jgi:hypothetical protein
MERPDVYIRIPFYIGFLSFAVYRKGLLWELFKVRVVFTLHGEKYFAFKEKMKKIR